MIDDWSDVRRQSASANVGGVQACNCIGPRNGEPLCRCAMRGVIVRDGRYIMPERDLGPVVPHAAPADRRCFRPFDVSKFWNF